MLLAKSRCEMKAMSLRIGELIFEIAAGRFKIGEFIVIASYTARSVIYRNSPVVIDRPCCMFASALPSGSSEPVLSKLQISRKSTYTESWESLLRLDERKLSHED